MMEYSNRYRIWSFVLLTGLVSAYGMQAWHNPALHHHDPCCIDTSDAHLHASETHCHLCDFVFIYDMPSQGLRPLVLPDIKFYRGDFHLVTRPGDKPLLGYVLRGPPAIAAFFS
jgi:hypothetical protein